MNVFSNTLLFIALFECVTGKSFGEQFLNISTADDCETSPESTELFGQRDNHYLDASGNVFCFRKRAGVSEMSSTSRLFDDPRFSCSNGPMTWYRGRRNVDFQGRPCIFWSRIANATFDISNGSSSSYSMKRILPDEFENFCRNPDGNPLGPWCHVEGGLRAPCFEPCRRDVAAYGSSKFSCLNKKGFPYTDYDMSDILDLPQLIQVFENVHLMYESRYVLPLSLDRLSTKTCINAGLVADSFGPWIAVFNGMSREFIRAVGRKNLRQLCVPPPPLTEEILIDNHTSSTLREAILEDELTIAGCTFWRRCFSSCQDDAASCWPKNTTAGYFGTKATSAEKKECLPWTQVASDILRSVRKSSNSSSSTSTMSKYHLYHALLFNDTQGFFVNSRLFLNTESTCMLLKRRSDVEKKSQYSSRFPKALWDAEFERMFQQGPGCFVIENKTIAFEQCYSTCSKPPNVTLTRKLCLVKGEYSICKPPRTSEWLTRGRKSDASPISLPLLLLSAVCIIVFYR